ncbi:hypothetical protein MGLY_27850 [Neomoorella glycerini]|uniref:Uncharacterized protein n=1 Tax=Neomoorella glycerini TaxID=55779 RepID=A0A6I5ZUZ8_9FIRM|nr:hypothetical protein [Moorella glycerini]QGP93377.1 hypothetical protein MGLY_27850 [Moorella glycerini]
MLRFLFSVFCLLFGAAVGVSLKGAVQYRPFIAVCFAGMLLCAGYLFWYHLAHIPRWREASREAGFRLLVLVPISSLLAWAVLFFSGAKLKTRKIRRAFELHIADRRKHRLAEFTGLLASDLSLLAGGLEPGTLIIWETRAPVPSAFRRYIRRKQAAGEAVWEKGGWGPARRFAARLARRGALVWTGRDQEYFFGRCSFEQESRDNHIFSPGVAVHGAGHHRGQCQVQAGK